MKSSNQCNEKPLADAIRAALNTKGMTIQEAAAAIDVSYIHLISLLNGARRLSGLSSHKLDLLASLTGIRKGQIYVLCGLLSPAEFYPAVQPDQVKLRLAQIQLDPGLQMCRLNDDDIENASDQVKLLLALLYEKTMSGAICASSENQF